jgi:hypothetical protein
LVKNGELQQYPQFIALHSTEKGQSLEHSMVHTEPVKYFQSMRRPCGGQLTLSKVSAIEETVCTIFHTGTKLGVESTSKNLPYKVLPLL